MDQTDVLASAQRSTSGQMLTSETGATIGRCRVKAIWVTPNPATAGTITLRDGGVSGAVKITYPFDNTTALSTSGLLYQLLPGEGVKFDTSIYATITVTTGTTVNVCVFYG
jgi:hypothetical protein